MYLGIIGRELCVCVQFVALSFHHIDVGDQIQVRQVL